MTFTLSLPMSPLSVRTLTADNNFDTMLGSKSRDVDLFPLPRNGVRRCPGQGLCRGTLKRLRKNEAVFGRVDGVYKALNEMTPRMQSQDPATGNTIAAWDVHLCTMRT